MVSKGAALEALAKKARVSPLSELRSAVKSLDRRASVSKINGGYQVKIFERLDEISSKLDSMGYKEFRKRDICGSRWDWATVLAVAPAFNSVD